MKTHAIIPIFISHRGCPHQCVFCNQKAITARSGDVTVSDARNTIEEWLTTLEGKDGMEVELSFFGGSFTGISMEEQTAFLKLAKEYKDNGRIDKIHCSTRPDYISREILDNLKAYGMDVIELGVQSFDQNVLDASERGHTEEDVEKACKLIHEYGFELGIQLMIGLPGDSYESCMYSVKRAIEMKPSIARLYPTVVIADTPLARMMEDGTYVPPSEEEIVLRTKDMYKALTSSGINVIRIGLKSNELIKGDTYHPAIGQIVKSAAARDEIEEKLSGIDSEYIEVAAPTELFNFAVGHKASNRKYFNEKYPRLRIKYTVDEGLEGICVRSYVPKGMTKEVKDMKMDGREHKAVYTAYVSSEAPAALGGFLELLGCKINAVYPKGSMEGPIACHPDIYYCLLKDRIYEGDASLLAPEYPKDVLYNAAAVGNYLICSKYTSKDLIESSGLTPVLVPQGYVKCNLAVLDDHHVITEDRGIAKVLEKIPDIDCLLISPGQVRLKGYDHGFIGGATGKVGNDIIFNGDLSSHSDFKLIYDFCTSCGLRPLWFDMYPLTDIGSILVV